MITNKTSAAELNELVRRIDEYVTIFADVSPFTPEELSILVSNLRDDVQTAHSLICEMERRGESVATEAMAATLDAALMVLNAHKIFGSIAQVELTVL